MSGAPVKSDAAHCAELVRTQDPDRWLTVLLAPAARRRALLALYAFNVELALVREQVREPMLGRLRLQFWRETLDGALTGRPRDVPVARELAALDFAADHVLLAAMVDARDREVDGAGYASLGDMVLHAEQGAAALMALAVQALGGAAPVREAAVATALVGLMRGMPGRREGYWRPALERRDLVREVCEEAERLLAMQARPTRALWAAYAPARLAGLYAMALRRAGWAPDRMRVSPTARHWRLLSGYLLNRI